MKFKNILLPSVIFTIFFLQGCEKLPEQCNQHQPQEDQCEGLHFGYEFKKGECEQVSWGCRNPPFETQEGCETTCKK